MTTRQRSIDTRDRILTAAQTLVAHDGFGALTMSTVATRAGVTRRTVYRHFPSRGDLANALAALYTPVRRTSSTPPPRNTPAPNTQRGSGRDRILEAARTLFATRGYANTTLREIAVRARISQPMLYRYFPSKDALFQESTIGPINDFMDAYWGRIDNDPPGPDRSLYDETRDVCNQMYDLLSANRGALFTFITADQFDSGHHAVLAQLFRESFDRLAEAFNELSGRRGLPETDEAVVIRLFFGMVLSAALHNDWLLRDTDTREHVVDQMARLLVHGITGPNKRR